MSDSYPTESLRSRLVAAGIPESQQSIDLLAAFIPLEFDTPSFRGMDADTLAEVLLYFIAKGRVKPPTTSGKILLNMPWGAHVCEFYDSQKGQLGMLVPYFKEGLERNETCIWVVADLTIQEATDALAAAVPDLRDRMAKGQIKIGHHSEFHTHDGRLRPIDDMIDQWKKIAVMANDSTGVRACGDASWINDEEKMAEFADYENKVNCVINNSRITAVCTYPTRLASFCSAKELPHSHSKILVKRGEWIYERLKDSQEIYEIFDSVTKKRHEAA